MSSNSSAPRSFIPPGSSTSGQRRGSPKALHQLPAYGELHGELFFPAAKNGEMEEIVVCPEGGN